MAKKTKVVVVQGLKVDGKYPPLGTVLALEAGEARRLLDLGAVALPGAAPEAPVPAPPPSGDEAALIEKIAAAQTWEELRALVPDDEQRAAVVEAANAKAEELGPLLASQEDAP